MDIWVVTVFRDGRHVSLSIGGAAKRCKTEVRDYENLTIG